jgi:hypothetical protein
VLLASRKLSIFTECLLGIISISHFKTTKNIMKKSILFVFALMLTISATAQKKVTLTIKHMLGTSPFTFTTASKNNLNKDFKLTRVEYYISQISIIHDGGMMTSVPNKYILANGNTNVNEELGTFSVTNVEGIKFYIGVEAPTNNGDPSLWSSFHPLAPKSPSMHWGWASGYRFVALEGNAGTSFTTPFEMHGLGNPNYFSQTVMATGVNSGSNITINLDADYVKALKDIDITTGPIDHGVNATDLDVLHNFRDHVFSPGTGLPTSITSIPKNAEATIYPNPSNGKFQLNVSGGNITNAVILDITGKEIKRIDLKGLSNFEITIENKGFYLLRLNNENTNVLNQKLIVN